MTFPQIHGTQMPSMKPMNEKKNGNGAGHSVDIFDGGPPGGMSSGRSTDSPTLPGICGLTPLTDRELQMLRLLSRDMATEEIADHLSLSRHTVRNYIRNAREKLRSKTRLSAVLTAQRLGLI